MANTPNTTGNTTAPRVEVDKDGLTEELAAARDGQAVDEKQERSGLAFLLAPEPVTLVYKMPVDIDTEAGTEKFIVRFEPIDPAKLESLERECRRADDGTLDTPKFNAHVCGEAVISITDASGEKISTGSPQWVATAPKIDGYKAKAAAMKHRFGKQGGLLDGINGRIQGVSGYDMGRIGVAQRELVEAGKA